MICSNKSILDGTNQLERRSESLDENYIKIDERSQQDLLEFVHKFSAELALYNLNNQPADIWQQVFNDLAALLQLIEAKEKDTTPHLALLFALTHLYGYAQDALNTLTLKHLDYYYTEVLRIQKKTAVGDEVQLVLQLAKSNLFDDYKLSAGTTFSAGKDIDGQSVIYKSDKEAIISRVEIDQLKSLFKDKQDSRTKFMMAPVANSLDGQGLPLSEDIPFWPTMGESQVTKAIEYRTMTEANFGFAISSHDLLLKEGQRFVNLTIFFEQVSGFVGYSSLDNSFDIFYSGDKGWERPLFHWSLLKTQDGTVATDGLWQLELGIEIGSDQPPFIFLDPLIHQEEFNVDSPLLRILMKPGSLAYDTIIQLKVNSVQIHVEAREMKNHFLQGDIGVLNPDSPFLPFGIQPSLNNSFYIGNAEIFQKKLSFLNIEFNWHDIPDVDLANYYAEYGIDSNFGNNNFDARVSMLLNGSWDHILRIRDPLFDSADATLPVTFTVSSAQLDFGADYRSEPQSEDLGPYTSSTKRGFIKFELSGPEVPFKAFGHKEFTKLYTEKAIALAAHDPASTDPVPVLPNPPYAPSMKELSITYEASKTIEVGSQNDTDKLFQLGPFGFRPIDSLYHKELMPLIEEEGSLFFGLSNFSPPQTVNMLFQLEEGTSNRLVLLEPENISWSYLVNDRWVPLSAQEILADGTMGFRKSGIISLTIPKEATDTNNYLPKSLFWIKVSIKEGAEGANMTRAIYTNAVNAALEIGRDNDFDHHLSDPLQEGTITGLLNKVREVKNVEQPLKSNKGFPSESAEAYYTRISERLRHKNRGVQLWDVERMVLKAFPDIFKVKCLNHTDPNSVSAAGSITLIIISNLRNKGSSNPFEPGTSQLVMDEVKAFIRNYISPFIQVYVELPLYESILIEAKIGFHPQFDPGFYSNQLNEELKQFLSPWAFEEGVDIEIGGAIYKSTILQFMESREYIDYVVDFNMYHRGGIHSDSGISEMEIDLDFEVASPVDLGIDDMIIADTYVVGQGTNVACATTARSILVTAQDHRITALRPDEFICSGASSLGIGFMTVNLDLIVEE